MKLPRSIELPARLRIVGTLPAKLVVAFVFIVGAGCQRDSEITKHVIPKSESNLELIRDAAIVKDTAPTTAANSEVKQARMVVAIASRPEAAWFFKISGPQDQVEATESQWKPFFEQLKFAENGNPKWDLPTDWKELGKKPMRFATLAINQESPPLELAISSLAAGQDLLANVNRWRGQLGLKPTTKSEMDAQLERLEVAGQELILFDETGQLSGRSGMPPFAGAAGRSGLAGAMNGGPPALPPAAEMDPTAEPSASSELTYETPPGWTKGPSSSIVRARLLKTADDKQVQISVVTLPAAANEWDPNVVRWAGEVGMTDVPKSELESLAAKIEVDGLAGDLVRLVPTDKDQAKGTIAAMVKQNSTAWFFKLTGDKSLVADSAADFDAFLKSVDLP